MDALGVRWPSRIACLDMHVDMRASRGIDFASWSSVSDDEKSLVDSRASNVAPDTPPASAMPLLPNRRNGAFIFLQDVGATHYAASRFRGHLSCPIPLYIIDRLANTLRVSSFGVNPCACCPSSHRPPTLGAPDCLLAGSAVESLHGDQWPHDDICIGQPLLVSQHFKACSFVCIPDVHRRPCSS
jgi:hypothetical protein